MTGVHKKNLIIQNLIDVYLFIAFAFHLHFQLQFLSLFRWSGEAYLCYRQLWWIGTEEVNRDMGLEPGETQRIVVLLLIILLVVLLLVVLLLVVLLLVVL